MDTKRWGPSGWRLLHLVATGPNAAKSKQFWMVLPYVLPCKFCRASLSTYYDQRSIPSKQEDFAEWLYKIHNLVNQKLRDQGQSVAPDPPFTAVQEQYTSLLAQGCSQTEFPGWDFLFSIADNHPGSAPSKPMPDVPEPPPKSLKERNRYNLLTPKERIQQLKIFWASIPAVLPFSLWQSAWKKNICSLSKVTKDRRSAMSAIWAIRCAMDKELHRSAKQNFYGLCKTIASYRSGCSKSTRAKTCRALRPAHRKTRRTKQR